MKRVILLILFLTSCTTLDPQSQAVVSVVNRGYDVTEIDLFTTVIKVDDRKNMPFQKPGYFDPETHDIYLLKDSTYDCEWHEWMHLYLLRCGVNIGEHHKIMGSRN